MMNDVSKAVAAKERTSLRQVVQVYLSVVLRCLKVVVMVHTRSRSSPRLDSAAIPVR